MITFDQLRDAVITYELDFAASMIEGETSLEKVVEIMSEIKDELSGVDCVEDIANYYYNSGYDLTEAYENIVKILMAKATV